ncbi:hypothetical protein C7B67_28240 [filamentous cyanobacterium Phorm 6]|nr:hypothetical protein C7B67_28240 [filamentous cyanobacterium Phorm 6]
MKLSWLVEELTEGRRKKEEGRRKKEEGRRKKEEGRGKKEEGRRKRENCPIPNSQLKLSTVNCQLSTDSSFNVLTV